MANLISLLLLLSCSNNLISTNRKKDERHYDQWKTIQDQKILNTSNCTEIINISKDSFLTLSHKYISYIDESKTIFCWISEIRNNNSELESILYDRLLLRYQEIISGNFKFINTNRINEVIFSELATEKMLEVAIKFASIDTCIYYPGEGPCHFGYVGLYNLIEMLDPVYKRKYDEFFLNYILSDNGLDKYDANSCIFMNILYDAEFAYINNDFINGHLKLRQTNSAIKDD